MTTIKKRLVRLILILCAVVLVLDPFGLLAATANSISNGKLIAITSSPVGGEPMEPAPSVDATTGWGGSLAYNSINNTWLVVSSLDGTHGRIMDNNGSPVINQFTLDAGPSGAPKSAFAPDINKYLVVWLSWDNADRTNVSEMMGRFVNPDGTFAGDAFLINKDNYPIEASFFNANSILRYDSNNRKFVLVWDYVYNRNGGINMITVSQSGLPGSVIRVVTAQSAGAGVPSLAINERSNEYCVAYDRRSDNPGHIGVKRVNAATGVVGPETRITVPVNSSMHTNIVYNTVERKYLLTWEDYTGGTKVKGKILDTCSMNGGGPTLTLANDGAASLAYNPKSNSYGVIVQNGNDFGNTYTILNFSGTKISSGLAFTGSRNGKGGNFNPFIAANTNDGTFAATSAIDYNPTRFAPNLGPMNQAPIGFFDGVSCDVIGGWAVDMDVLEQPVRIQIFINGPEGQGRRVFSGLTTGLRIDVNSVLGIIGNHGFTIPTPASIKDGLDHEVWIYAQDLATLQNMSFEGSPKIFNARTQPVPCDTTTPDVTYVDLGAGAFPDVVWFRNRLWVAYRSSGSRSINLLSFDSELQDRKTEKIFNLNPGAGGFPRLTVSDDTLWLAFRDGESSGEDIKLWRQDTGAIESLGPAVGNDPVALGYGYVAWQKLIGASNRVYIRALTGENSTLLRNGFPTGIARVLSDATVVMIDTDRTAVSWGLSAWFAGDLTVATDITPHDDNGVVARFNNYQETEFNLWLNQRAHTPHAATDGAGNYAVATWNPTVRVAVFTGPVSTAPSPGPVYSLDCDPLPDDPNLILECNVYDLANPIQAPGPDPATEPEPNPEPSQDLDCDPLPDDISLILQCNIQDLINP